MRVYSGVKYNVLEQEDGTFEGLVFDQYRRVLFKTYPKATRLEATKDCRRIITNHQKGFYPNSCGGIFVDEGKPIRDKLLKEAEEKKQQEKLLKEEQERKLQELFHILPPVKNPPAKTSTDKKPVDTKTGVKKSTGKKPAKTKSSDKNPRVKKSTENPSHAA